MDVQFPEGFLWGTATASYQVEGGVHEGGRGESIWDTFSRTPGKIARGHTGDVAVDQYHRFQEDAGLMADLGIGAYRFSLAWPRIQPEGRGKFNPPGMDYYLRLSEELLRHGIKPVVTLYHWDLPQTLQDRGGWPERDTAFRFADYAAYCFESLSPYTDRWITLNEPLCSSIYAYQEGVHAPGWTDPQAAYSALHHLNLAHGMSLEIFRQEGYPGEIGISLNAEKPRPSGSSPEDRLAADRAADRNSRMFLDPLFGRGYPERHLQTLSSIVMPIEEGDMDIIAGPLDFLGINYYFELAAAADNSAPEGYRIVQTSLDKTDMGWDIVPEGLTRLLHWINGEYGPLPLYITENGCAMADELREGKCSDPGRASYLKDHLQACSTAIAEGVDLRGYFLWSFIDNFEWAYGYTKRFGIVHCDYETLQRTPKESFHFYKSVISKNGFDFSY